MEGEGRTDLVLGEDLDQDLAAADCDIVGDLGGALGFKSDVALASVDALVVSPLHLADADAEGADEHRDGGVGDVVRHADQADHHGVVADVHHGDMDATDVEAVLGQVGETLSLTEADEHLAARLSHALHLAQLGVKLTLQLVNDLGHRDVTQDGVVFCTKHHRVGFYRVETHDVAAVGAGGLGTTPISSGSRTGGS